MVITLGPELEKIINELAQQRGVSPEALALETLRDRFIAPMRTAPAEDEWVRRLRQIATDCGVSLSDEAVSSEGIYD